MNNKKCFNPFNAELNPICHLLAFLGAHHILHVSRIRVNLLLYELLLLFCDWLIFAGWCFFSLQKHCDGELRLLFSELPQYRAVCLEDLFELSAKVQCSTSTRSV
jgi:hypothetical protein